MVHKRPHEANDAQVAVPPERYLGDSSRRLYTGAMNAAKLASSAEEPVKGKPTDRPRVIHGAVRPDDEDMCWLCGRPVTRRHCKLICPHCGFTRDCSDP
jgi:hypothetical protein